MNKTEKLTEKIEIYGFDRNKEEQLQNLLNPYLQDPSYITKITITSWSPDRVKIKHNIPIPIAKITLSFGLTLKLGLRNDISELSECCSTNTTENDFNGFLERQPNEKFICHSCGKPLDEVFRSVIFWNYNDREHEILQKLLLDRFNELKINPFEASLAASELSVLILKFLESK